MSGHGYCGGLAGIYLLTERRNGLLKRWWKRLFGGPEMDTPPDEFRITKIWVRGKKVWDESEER